MAIVADKSGNSTQYIIGNAIGGVDRPYCTPNRTTGAPPNGALTPLYAGERVVDTSTNLLWEAWGPLNTNWQQLSDMEKTGA